MHWKDKPAAFSPLLGFVTSQVKQEKEEVSVSEKGSQ